MLNSAITPNSAYSPDNPYRSIVEKAIDDNNLANATEIYNDIIRDNATLQLDKEFNDNFIANYNRKKKITLKSNVKNDYAAYLNVSERIPKPGMYTSTSGRNTCFQG